MQFNQPINSCFQNEQFYPRCPQFPPNIMGEGNVVSMMHPDGSVQFFFIPTQRQDRGFPYSYCPSQIPWPGMEAWFVRKILSAPIPMTHERYGDPFLRSYYASKCNMDLCPQTGYLQKFHTDNVTSTTDIHYFFPLKVTKKNCAVVQVEYPTKFNISCQTADCKLCSCPSKPDCPTCPKKQECLKCETKKQECLKCENAKKPKECAKCESPKKCQPKMVDSSSCMSIDEQSQTRRKQKRAPKVRFKSPCKPKERCSCKQRKNGKSDKMVFTYSDQATNCSGTCTDSQTIPKSSSAIVIASKSLMSCDSSSCNTCLFCTTDCTTDE